MRINYIPNRVIDQNGISDGASLYAYQAGTTTPVNLYTDPDFDFPIGNPYVAAAGAAIPALYTDYVGNIRLKIIPDNGGTIEDYDPYDPLDLDQTITDRLAGRTSIIPQDFGAVGDGVTNDGPAFAAAIAYLVTNAPNLGYGYSRGSPQLFIPKGHYYLGTTTLDLTVSSHIFGESAQGACGPSSILRWAAGTTGFRLQAGNTSGASGTQTESGKGADGTIIEKLALLGSKVNSGAGADGEFHAIHLRTTAKMEDLYIEGWQGDGIYANCTAGSGGATEGNANNLRANDIYFENCRRAMFLDGADTNAGYYSGFKIKNMRDWGIYDSCFLSSTHIGHLAQGCTTGPYKSDGVNARVAWIGCYSESGQPASSIIYPGVVVGGIHAADFTAGSTALQIGAPSATYDIKSVNPAKLGNTTVAEVNSTTPILTVHDSAALASTLPARMAFAQGAEVAGTPCLLAQIYAIGNTANPATTDGKLYFTTRTNGGTGGQTDRMIVDGQNLTVSAGADNTMDLGQSGLRWKTAYVYNINVTTSIACAGAIASTSPTAGIGYATGAGGTVTQITSKTTGVTLNKICGAITTHNASLAANTIVSFTLTNSSILADDDVRVWVKSGNASVGSYRVAAEGNAAGSRTIVIENKTAGALSEALVLGVNIYRTVTS